MHVPWAAMKTTQLTLQFNTPAFLGNAFQEGQWRTPPFKALLRQWWRVAYAAERGFDRVDVKTMRHEEGMLFGHAWLEDDWHVPEGNAKPVQVHGRQSLVRIRLVDGAAADANAWTLGKQQGVDDMRKSLDTSYAWYGLVDRVDQPNRTGIKATPHGESTRVLRLAAPQEHMARLDEVASLANAFGLMGSRSRGGWGALQVLEAKPLTATQMQRYARPLQDCLKNDWAMSLATHQRKPALWHSKEPLKDWGKAMEFIAVERRNVRTSLKALGGKDLRPALGFATPGRMPSPLRWKVVPAPEGKGLSVRIFAMPHAIPAGNGPRMEPSELLAAWTAVFNTLQDAKHLVRLDA